MRIILLIILLGFNYTISAQKSLQEKTILLVRFFEKNHYQPIQWNDSSAAILYDQWLETLDDEKLFFTQKELAVLAALQPTLVDELKGGSWKFYPASISAYKKSLQRADSILSIVLSKPFDLLSADNITWPATDVVSNEQALTQRWFRYCKWQLLRKLADHFVDKGTDLSKISIADLNKVEAEYRNKMLLKEKKYIADLLGSDPSFEEKMSDAFLNTIAECYDPHSSYMNLADKNEFATEMSAAAYSVGLDITMDEKGDKKIAFLQPGGSAWRSGQLHVGDVLVKIKTGPIEVLVADVEIEEVESYLQGSSELEIELTVQTAAGENKTLKLAKEKISDEESVVKSYVLAGKKNIGYINLPGFYSRESDDIKSDDDLTLDGCANDVSKEILKLKKDSIAGLILDLRYNGGGSMWEATQLAGIFIDIGPVASVKDKDGKSMFLKDPNRGTIYDGPLLVLINGFSASASEFLTAVLQDYNRALIVGSNTYGKGTAQTVQPLDTMELSNSDLYKDFVKITESKFYRVNGSTAQWKGVTPDVFLPDIYSSDVFKEKAQKTALLPDGNKPGYYTAMAALPIPTLKANSERRVKNHPYFNTVQTFAQMIEQLRKGTSVPLNWLGYQQYYLQYKGLLKKMDEFNNIATAVIARNNAFDVESMQQSNARQLQNNEVYLQQLQKDAVIEEALKIITEWTSNQ